MEMNELDQAVAKPSGIAVWILCGILVLIGLSTAVSIYIRLHFFNRTTAQEQRSSEWVGEKVPPKAPVKIEVRNDPHVCIRIEFAGLNSDHLYVFVRRLCGKAGDYAEGHWRAEAADGTVIDSGYTNWQVDNEDKGQRAEWDPWQYETFDARITKVVIWTSGEF